ncbi:DUF882 domain-containing protein [Polyangium aurulentum]|uniref:DUF882 domain-containing protein n=1 Tax=Polyangium aurulentum TaxID=2567896 RepID=UPI0010ADB7D0|nr:DUF882 domain-containing protein [Polyangium aurulentum]UQA61685.1 DUF882 domain-containing protein [Polyangium aurulentum]
MASTLVALFTLGAPFVSNEALAAPKATKAKTTPAKATKSAASSTKTAKSSAPSAKTSPTDKPASHVVEVSVKDTKPASASSAKSETKGGSGRKAKKVASRTPADKEKKKTAKKAAPAKPCFAAPVTLDRSGLEGEAFSLVDCKGKPLDEAREKLSLLARPWGTARPKMLLARKSKTHVNSKSKKLGKGEVAAVVAEEPAEIAPNIRLLDPGLLARVEAIAKRFPGKGLSLVSGYRPQSRGSLHQSARALDLRVNGVANEELVAFCKTLADTGCGYYPNSSFVHVDVRAPGTGSVTWIDASGPGESPRYVTQWPPPPEETMVAQPVVPPANQINDETPRGDATSHGELRSVEPNEGKEPAAKEPAAAAKEQAAAAKEPAAEKPAAAAKEPAAKEPAADKPAASAKEPAVKEPAAVKPVAPAKEPAADKPAAPTKEPAAVKPAAPAAVKPG